MLDRLAYLSPVWRPRWRVLFWIYAAALFTGTHPTVPDRGSGDRASRPDHSSGRLLEGGSARSGSRPTSRRERRDRGGRSGCVRWSPVCTRGEDELLQGIPGLNRTVAWDDYGCNVLGIAAGAAIASLVHIFTPISTGERTQA